MTGSGGALDATVTTAGTYRLVVGDSTFATGGVAVTISDQQNAGAIMVGAAKTITFGRAGQSARMTFAGTAGQNLNLNASNVTLPFYPAVWVIGLVVWGLYVAMLVVVAYRWLGK